jgi:hypothetical protein
LTNKIFTFAGRLQELVHRKSEEILSAENLNQSSSNPKLGDVVDYK